MMREAKPSTGEAQSWHTQTASGGKIGAESSGFSFFLERKHWAQFQYPRFFYRVLTPNEHNQA